MSSTLKARHQQEKICYTVDTVDAQTLSSKEAARWEGKCEESFILGNALVLFKLELFFLLKINVLAS